MQAGIAVVVVALVAAGGWYWYSAQQHRVAAAYAAVLTRAHAAANPQAPQELRTQSTQELERVLAEHPTAGPVAEAALELGNLRYAARQYGPARSAYEIAAGRGDSPTIRILARLSIGYTWEAERDFPKAVDAYQAIVRDLQPRDFLFEEALLALARGQELAGRKPEAVASYQRLLKDVPGTRRADEVKMRLATLGAGPAS